MPAVPRTRGLTDEAMYGYGWQEVVAGITPAAGAEYTYTVPGQYQTRVHGIVFLLTTSADVANRYVTVQFCGGDLVPFAISGAAVLVTASSAAQFAGDAGRGTAEWNTGTGVFFPLADAILEPGEKVKIDVDAIQAADTLTNIRLLVDRYPTGPRGYPEGVDHGRRPPRRR